MANTRQPGHVIDLSGFNRDEARALLLDDVPQLANDPVLEKLLEHCADLPLAVRVAGSTLANNPALSPQNYLARLEDAQRRPNALRYEDTDVYAILGVGDDALSAAHPELSRRWRMLGVCSAPFEAATAAAVWDELDEDVVVDALGLYSFAATPTLTNNVFAQNRDSEGGGGIVADGGSISLLHNTIADNRSTRTGTLYGVWLRFGAEMTAANNIIANHAYGVYLMGLGTRATRATLTHTLFHGTDAERRVAGDGVIGNAQVVAGDRLFVSTSTAAPDYHIRANSAAREAGQGSNLASDVDGRIRPLGLPDLGADEYAVHTFLPGITR